MPPKKRNKRNTSQLNPAIKAKSARMVHRLRDHHRLGREAIRSRLSTAEFAAKNGMNIYTMRRIMKFARMYSRAELVELCRLRRPNGLPLQIGHVWYLLIVDDPVQRTKLAERAARSGWSASEVNAAVPRKYRVKKGHGRSMKTPATPESGLQELADEAGRWSRRAELVVPIVMGRTERGVSRRLQDRVEEAIAEVGKLEKAARESRRALERLLP